MNPLLLNPRLLAGLALAAALAGIGWWGYNLVYDRGAQAVQVKWDAEKQAQAEQSAKVATEAMTATKTLQASADQQRKASNAQIAALNSSLAAAVAGLSDRPSRGDAGGVSGSPGNGAGCYPSQLYREDAEVAIQLTGEADQLRVALQHCQTRYQSVYEALNGQKE